MSIELVSYVAFFLTVALTYGIMCLGLNVQWGQTGLFNVGVAGFVAIGAYVSAIMTTPDDPDRFGGFDLPIIVGWIGRRWRRQSSRSSSAFSRSGCGPTIWPSRRSASPSSSSSVRSISRA